MAKATTEKKTAPRKPRKSRAKKAEAPKVETVEPAVIEKAGAATPLFPRFDCLILEDATVTGFSGKGCRFYKHQVCSWKQRQIDHYKKMNVKFEVVE